jgi:hypothetical protein
MKAKTPTLKAKDDLNSLPLPEVQRHARRQTGVIAQLIAKSYRQCWGTAFQERRCTSRASA